MTVASTEPQVAGAPWHTFDAETAALHLATRPEGLTPDEAQARLARDGPNEMPETPPTSALVVLLHRFGSPLIYILLAAALVTLLLEEYIDAGVIAAVLALNALIGFSQESRAEQSVRALMRLMAPRARVIRDNREWEIESRALVAGDVVLLESGARVPADLRMLSATALRIDESLLTGEALPVTKTAGPLEPLERPLADRTDMACMGTVVSSGRGRGYVVATAVRTQLGSIAESVRGKGETETPLQGNGQPTVTAVRIMICHDSSGNGRWSPGSSWRRGPGDESSRSPQACSWPWNSIRSFARGADQRPGKGDRHVDDQTDPHPGADRFQR